MCLCHRSHSAAVPDRRDLLSRSEGGRREKAGEPCSETRRKVIRGESAGGHRVERSRMIWEIRGYAGIG